MYVTTGVPNGSCDTPVAAAGSPLCLHFLALSLAGEACSGQTKVSQRARCEVQRKASIIRPPIRSRRRWTPSSSLSQIPRVFTLGSVQCKPLVEDAG